MSEKLSEKSKMSALEFAQHALRTRVAPKAMGSVKERLRHATSVLRRRNWSANRVKDLWYADCRARPIPDEILDLEELTGLKYGRQEVDEIDALIARADALMDGPDADFYSPWVAGFRAFIGALYRP